MTQRERRFRGGLIVAGVLLFLALGAAGVR